MGVKLRIFARPLVPAKIGREAGMKIIRQLFERSQSCPLSMNWGASNHHSSDTRPTWTMTKMSRSILTSISIISSVCFGKICLARFVRKLRLLWERRKAGIGAWHCRFLSLDYSSLKAEQERGWAYGFVAPLTSGSSRECLRTLRSEKSTSRNIRISLSTCHLPVLSPTARFYLFQRFSEWLICWRNNHLWWLSV